MYNLYITYIEYKHLDVYLCRPHHWIRFDEGLGTVLYINIPLYKLIHFYDCVFVINENMERCIHIVIVLLFSWTLYIG